MIHTRNIQTLVSFRGMAALLLVVMTHAAAAQTESKPPIEPTPDKPPAWVEGYRVRYALRVVGDPAAQTPRTVIASVPTGGWLRPDGSDVAVRNAAGQTIPVAVLSHDPTGDTVVQFQRSGNDRWYWLYAVNPAAPSAPAQGMGEGVVAEFRQWEGDTLDNWAAVVDGLKKSENVIGNAIVAEVIQNSNPARPSTPRNFAASYRGYLNIRTAGVYRFIVNAEDAAFLFIDGFKVYERAGRNERITGRVSHSAGSAVELTAGIHAFEVHHVIGNNPRTYGYCSLLWLPPGSRAWGFVPPEAFEQSMLATAAGPQEAGGAPAAAVAFGMDDTLSSGGVTAYLTRFEAQGAIRDANGPVWDFGDGVTGQGASVRHVYFREGAYKVTLKSAGTLPPFTRTVCVWPAPGVTSPLSLGGAVRALEASDWKKLDTAKQRQMFEFLLICEQPGRWLLLEALTRQMLGQAGDDPETRVLATVSLMEAVARQGRGGEALKLGEAALKEFAAVPSLMVSIKLEMAWVRHRHLRDLGEAARLYQALIEEHRRLEVPEVRLAAIRLGDLYTEAGDLAKAGESYRMANTLGGESVKGSTAQSDAITRGAMLRVAEQKLRAGDVRQTRKLLEKIEVSYPEQKLEGLYRFLRAEADRAAGRYEDAVGNYEVLLRLSQWAGFRDRALFGVADTYYRMGDFAKSLDWLATVEESFPAFYEKEKLGKYQRMVAGRLARQRAATQPAATDAPAPGGLFTGFRTGLEPDETGAEAAISGWVIAPGMGMDGPHVGLIESVPASRGYATYVHRLRNITSNGYYWFELWFRDTRSPFAANAHVVASLYGAGSDQDPLGNATVSFQRGYGRWRKLGVLLKAPVTQDGRIEFSLRLLQGVTEIDALSVTPVSDRQHDALTNFVEGVIEP